jgi:hypothetical protein
MDKEEGIIMLYPFMTLPDETEIVHSESIIKDGTEMVKVVVERPVDYGFKSAVCWLPDYRWEKVEGFTPAEIDELQGLIQSLAHIIYELARDGGFEHAAVV